MKWTSVVSLEPGFADALSDACSQLETGLDGARADLVLAFVSGGYGLTAAVRTAASLPEALRPLLSDGGRFVGATAHSVIGGGREVEEAPALALVGATLAGVSVATFHVVH